MTSEREYYVMMLRAWQEGTSPDGYRFSLENVQSGRRIGFATLEELCAYLGSRFSHSGEVVL